MWGAFRSIIKGGLALFGVLCFAAVFYFAFNFFISTNLSTPLASFTALPAATTPTPTPTANPITATALQRPTITAPTAIGEMIESTENVSRNYTWNYRGKWTWEMHMPVSLYDYYRNLPRPRTNNYSVYVTHPLDDVYIDTLVEKMKNAAQRAHYTELQTVEFAAAFVQSLPYTLDSVTSPYDEYPRYPAETLVDNGGDCEDTSILLASILDRMGYKVVLLNPLNHMAVGVKISGNISGSSWEYKGDNYYYIETTGLNWRIGQLPDRYKDAAATVYPIVPVPIVSHEGNFQSHGSFTDIELKITNLGTAPAANVTVLAGYDAGGGMLWNSQRVEPFTLDIDQETTVKLTLRIPPREHTRILVQIVVDGVLVDESFSDWFDT
ncbi:MAG: hypothetical protein Q7J73_07230 [Dehalococcoidales bacterium]|nr:hypothetical protein [Dehalococcoidales bacterium]